jgi:hypothetical protein
MYYWGLQKLGVQLSDPIFESLDEIVAKNFDKFTL